MHMRPTPMPPSRERHTLQCTRTLQTGSRDHAPQLQHTVP